MTSGAIQEGEEETARPTIAGAFTKDGVDLTAIHWMLSLTPAQRLKAAQDLIDAARALQSTDEV